MPTVGDVGGLNYRIPQGRYINQQAIPVQAQPAAEPELGLPNLNDNYANVRGISDEFYNTVGQIKSYAHDLAKNYGIDVTKPDYSQAGGGQPFRTFQELTAKATMLGNDLKESMRRNTLDEAAIRAGTFLQNPDFDPTTQMSSQVDAQQRGTSTDLLPEVKVAANALSRVYDTQSGAARATASFKQPLVQKLQQLISTDPENAAFYQRQINALPDAIYEPPIFAPRAGEEGKTQKRQAIVDLYKRTTNLIKGAWDEGTFDTTLDENFKPIFKNTELSGMSLGNKDFVVKKQKKTYPLTVDSIISKDGKMFLRFVQPEEARNDNFSIPDEEITGTKGDLFLKRVIEKGKGLGVNTTELVTALKEADLYSETGSKDDKVVRKDLIKGSNTFDTSRLDKAVDAVKKSMKETKRGPVYRGTLPSGQQIEVIKNNPLIGSVNYTVSIDGDGETYSEKDALSKMREYGVFNEFLMMNQPNQSAPSGSTTVNKGGKKAYSRE